MEENTPNITPYDDMIDEFFNNEELPNISNYTIAEKEETKEECKKEEKPKKKIRLRKPHKWGIFNVYNDKERSMTKNEKKITWSKVWLAITGILFFLDLVTCLIAINTNVNIMDTAVMVTSISVTGAIFGTNLVWYSKKAASENHYKLRMAMYEDVVNQRLYFTEEMLKLKRKYKADDEEIAEIDSEGEIASLMDEAFSGINNKLNQEQDEYESPNEIQTFNL